MPVSMSVLPMPMPVPTIPTVNARTVFCAVPMPAPVFGIVTVVDEVDVTERHCGVRLAVLVGLVPRVPSAWSARLDVGVAIGANDERVRVAEVETIIPTFSCTKRAKNENDAIV